LDSSPTPDRDQPIPQPAVNSPEPSDTRSPAVPSPGAHPATDGVNGPAPSSAAPPTETVPAAGVPAGEERSLRSDEQGGPAVPACREESSMSGREETALAEAAHAGGNADEGAAPDVPLTPVAWLMQNSIYLAFMVAGVIWLYSSYGWEGLPSAALTIFGIGFIIFVHELGHFAVAKWCDVHVLTFSIGFGPAIPGCSFKRGETTYKIGLLPLGGYVNMVGEGPDAEEAEDYPRSFKNKSVGQRMAIISAGVIMNVLFGILAFIFVFRTHGVERTDAVVGSVSPGSPAWQAGVHPGWKIIQIGNNDHPFFEDLRTKVALSGKGEKIPFVFLDPETGKKISLELEPRRGANNLNPVIGVVAPGRLELLPPTYKKIFAHPYGDHSPAAYARVLALGPGDVVLRATDSDDPKVVTELAKDPKKGPWYSDLAERLRDLSGKPLKLVVARQGKATAEAETVGVPVEGFQFGDRIVGMTDPALALAGKEYDPFVVSLLPPNPRDPEHDERDPFAFRERLQELAGKPIIIQVRRYRAKTDSPLVNLFVPPAFHHVLGARMKIGEVAAVREDSPAAKAGVRPRSTEGNQEADKLVGVRVYRSWWGWSFPQPLVAIGKSELDKKVVQAEPLDPVRLPFQLARAARKYPGKKTVTLIVARKDDDHRDGQDHALTGLAWDENWDSSGEIIADENSPMSIPQLGLAYWVTSEVQVGGVEKGSPAARAVRLEKVATGVWDRVPDPIRPPNSPEAGDVIYRIRVPEKGNGSPVRWSPWIDLVEDQAKKSEKWAYAFQILQAQRSRTVQLGIRRNGKNLEDTFEVTLAKDRSWPLERFHRGLRLTPDDHLHKADSTLEALTYGVQETWRFISSLYLGLSRLITGRVSAKTLGGPVEIVSTTFTLASDDIYKLILFLAILSINLAVINFLPIPLLDGGHMVFLIYEKLRGKPPSERVRAIATYIGLFFLLSLMVYVFYLDLIVKGRLARLFGG
jgi:membrane-associated protease RseP (regulator of RpoE activity)